MTLRDRLDAAMAQLRPSQPVEKTAKALPPGAAPLLWCVLLTGVGIAALVGSTWMLLVFVAGSVGHVDWHSDYSATNEGPASFVWSVSASIHWLVGVGLFLFCAAIAMFNATWLEARRHLAPGLMKNTMTAIGVAVALFMISGAIVVQQKGSDARAQDSAKAVQTARAGVAAVDAEIASIETEMARLCAPSLTTWQAQACRSGEAAWTDRVAIAKRQKSAQIDIIERAMADAKAGDAWRAQLRDLRKQRAVAAVTTVSEEVQTVKAEGWMAAFTAFLEDVRKPVTATLGELLAMIAFGLAMSAWATRRAHEDVVAGALNGVWADEEHMIPDYRAEAPIDVLPMDAKYQGDLITDPETRVVKKWIAGYEKKYPDGSTKYFPGHYRATGRFDPLPADDVGVVLDSDSRAARSVVESGDAESDSLPLPTGSADDAVGRVSVDGADEAASAQPGEPAARGDDPAGALETGYDQGSQLSPDTTDFLDSLIGPAQELGHEVYDEPAGPPAPSKPLPNGEGIMVAAE